jgi:hypothetical protein
MDHWERFAFDKAGCRLCGNIHICSTKCEHVEEQSDSTICIITGLCIHTIQFRDERVFLNTAQPMLSTSAKRRHTGLKKYSFQDIETVVRHVMCSKQTLHSFILEKNKLQKRVSGCCQRVMRMHRSATPSRLNMLTVTQDIASELENTRVVPSFADTQAVEEVAAQCSACIFTLLHTCQKLIPQILNTTSLESFIIGALYIMRTGITIKNFELLKCVVELRSFLPLESLLQQCFNIKPKIITEVENLIKSNMRQVSKMELHKFEIVQ